MCSAAVLLPALPGRSSPATSSPDPSQPWSTNATSGWCPKVFFQVLAACSFSECARSSTPSRSTITSPPAFGAALPANFHTRSRISVRALRIVARARGPAAARLSTRRETVGSEATGLNTAGSARNIATSAGQSLSRAEASTVLKRILPGWCSLGRTPAVQPPAGPPGQHAQTSTTPMVVRDVSSGRAPASSFRWVTGCRPSRGLCLRVPPGHERIRTEGTLGRAPAVPWAGPLMKELRWVRCAG